MTRHVLAGLRSTPLASYLAGLGLIRLLGEQADPDLTAAWSDEGLALETTVDDIATWLVDHYIPTPVLSPWNGGSGFGERGRAQREALHSLVSMPGERLQPYRLARDVAATVAERIGSDGWSKERAVRDLRNRCPDQLLPWIDATVVLANDQLVFPPLLGTGGNDGRLEFSHTFHKRLLEVLDPQRRDQSTTHARDLLSGEQVGQLATAMMGQFDPAGAGGKGSSPFGDAESLGNPWQYVLLVEGAMMFASTVARRSQHAAPRAARPFTVDASPDGSTSGADSEVSSSRGEVWAPLWERPFTLAEIRQLFTEARASWRGRPAQRAVDFYAATRTLGVTRGVAAFVRYGLHQRNGLAFVAVPIERVDVRERPEVRLAAQLEEWVSWVRRGEATTAVGRAVRRFDAAHLTFARDGGALPLARLLAALTDLEQAAGRSGRTRSNVPVRRAPRATDFLTVLIREQCPELRVSVGLASCATLAGSGPSGRSSRTLRQLLLPVDPDGRWRDAPLVPGFGLRPLPEVLADVLVWRSRTAADEPDEVAFRGVATFRRGVPVPATDLHDFAAGRLDRSRLDLWLRACLALRWDGVRPQWRAGVQPGLPVPTLALLHPLAGGLAPQGGGDDSPRLALAPDWATRLAAGQVAGVHADAARRLRQAGWDAVPAPPRTGAGGSALAAALVPRCRGAGAVLERVALRLAAGDAVPQPDAPPTSELVGEMS